MKKVGVHQANRTLDINEILHDTPEVDALKIPQWATSREKGVLLQAGVGNRGAKRRDNTMEYEKVGAVTHNQMASERRQKVKWLRAAGIRKAEIARLLKVSSETIRRDCIILDIRTKRAEICEIIGAVLIVTRRESTGDVSTVEACLQIEQLIEDATDVLRQ